MVKIEYYRLCLKAGNFTESPTFRIVLGKQDKTIHAYYVPSDKQRYNYDVFLERREENEILIEVFMNEKMIGKGMLRFDVPNMLNQNVEIIEGEEIQGVIECSLKKMEKQERRPEMKIRVIEASFTVDLDTFTKMDPFVVIKYGDNNYKTKVIEGGGKNPVWKEEFSIGTTDNDRIFIESWEEDVDGCEFIGVSTVDVSKIGEGELDIEIIKEKNKQGLIKIELLENEGKNGNEKQRQINDKNMIKKRVIKASAVEAVLKEKPKKGSFIRLQVGDLDFETIPIFTENKELKWNQSFQMKCTPGDELIAKLCLKGEIEEEIGGCSIMINEIRNKKYELSLLEGKREIGKLYLEFYDEELDIKEEIVREPREDPKSSMLDKQEIQSKQNQNEKEIKAIKEKYSSRQSIHDYMAEVNNVLQQGLLMIARDRPEDPIKQLGLYLINYKN